MNISKLTLTERLATNPIVIIYCHSKSKVYLDQFYHALHLALFSLPNSKLLSVNETKQINYNLLVFASLKTWWDACS